MAPRQVIPDAPKVVQRGIGCDLAKGMARSRIVRSMVVTGLVVAILFALSMQSPPWGKQIIARPSDALMAAAGGGSFGGALLLQILLDRGWGKLKVDVSAIARARNWQRDKYNLIIEVSEIVNDRGMTVELPNSVKIFLGGLPNRLTSDLETLLAKEGIENLALVSVNEEFEREARFVSLPYQEQDLTDLGIVFHNIDALDHEGIDDKKIEDAVNFIIEQMKEGKSIYVHCLAGLGRSGQIVWATLMKAIINAESGNRYTLPEARAYIKAEERRPDATIDKKEKEAAIEAWVKRYPILGEE